MIEILLSILSGCLLGVGIILVIALGGILVAAAIKIIKLLKGM